MLKVAILLAAVAVCYGTEPLTKYYLFTRKTPTTAELLDITASNAWLDGTNLNPNDNTIILIHGHHGKALDEFTRITRNEIFAHQAGEHNIIVVDWEEAASYNYATASANVQLVANELTAFMKLLTELQRSIIDNNGVVTGQEPDPVNLAKLHLVGFGLGAHVAGIASRQVATPTLGQVGRITGLDPSGSRWGSNSGRLREGDASYVEVIHTDGSGVLANGIGTAIGQINFYANGGSNQPGCLTHSCSHNRAWELFAASMRNTNLRGNSCSTMTQMNLNLCRGLTLTIGGTSLYKLGVSSIYRFNTGRNYPF